MVTCKINLCVSSEWISCHVRFCIFINLKMPQLPSLSSWITGASIDFDMTYLSIIPLM